MASEVPGSRRQQPLTVFFLPFLSGGHMYPMIDVAKLFAERGVNGTIIGTPANATAIRKAIGSFDISVELLPFPSVQYGLPEGSENLSACCTTEQSRIAFFRACDGFKDSVEAHLRRRSPDLLIADELYLWAARVAADLNIPRLVFTTMSLFHDCVRVGLTGRDELTTGHDDKIVIVPGLPGDFKFLRKQLFILFQIQNEHNKQVLDRYLESDRLSCGRIVNSFRELEGEFIDFYRNTVGKIPVWFVGPVFLRNVDPNYGKGNECMEWLNAKAPATVLYVCFGSYSSLTATQKRELAIGLDVSGVDFLWVLRSDDELEWLPNGFKKKVDGKGLLVTAWVPQVAVLNHTAVGGFLTHCGWNSVIESVCAGVPVIAWPMFADQFSNEKIVVEKLKIGISGGPSVWSLNEEEKEVIKGEAISEKVRWLMAGDGGKEAEQMRKRAKELAETAKRAVAETGSSTMDVDAMVEYLQALRTTPLESATK